LREIVRIFFIGRFYNFGKSGSDSYRAGNWEFVL
jgi:hypothetical protein